MLNGFVCIGILLNVFLYFFELLAPFTLVFVYLVVCCFFVEKKWI